MLHSRFTSILLWWRLLILLLLLLLLIIIFLRLLTLLLRLSSWRFTGGLVWLVWDLFLGGLLLLFHAAGGWTVADSVGAATEGIRGILIEIVAAATACRLVQVLGSLVYYLVHVHLGVA